MTQLLMLLSIIVNYNIIRHILQDYKIRRSAQYCNQTKENSPPSNTSVLHRGLIMYLRTLSFTFYFCAFIKHRRHKAYGKGNSREN